MKKFLAIVFALIFALSAATSAFALANTCPHCSAVIETEKGYNDHISKTCPVLFPPKACKYEGCGAIFQDDAEYERHLDICPKKVLTTEEKIKEFIEGIDFEALFAKVGDLVGKIDLSAIGDALGNIDFEGILAKITPVIEELFAKIKASTAE